MGVGYLLRGKHYRATRKIALAQRMLMAYFSEGHDMVLEAKHHHGMALLACGDYQGALASHLFVMRSRLQVPTNQYAPIDSGDPSARNELIYALHPSVVCSLLLPLPIARFLLGSTPL